MGDHCKGDRGYEQTVRLQMTEVLRLQNIQRFTNAFALMYDCMGMISMTERIRGYA